MSAQRDAEDAANLALMQERMAADVSRRLCGRAEEQAQRLNNIIDALGAPNLIAGDNIIFERRNKWWRRTLIWMRLMKPDSPPKQFTVSWSNPSKPFGA